MSSLCGMVFLICIIGLIIWIIASIKEAYDKALEDKRNRINSNTSTINSNVLTFRNRLCNYFINNNSNPVSVYSSLMGNIDAIKETNVLLKKDAPESGKEGLIEELTKSAEEFKRFTERANGVQYRTVISTSDYGRCNKNYWNEILSMNAQTVDQIIQNYHLWLENGQTEKFADINPSIIPACVWFYANEKPYSVSKFNAARETFFYVYKGRFVDLTIAEFYAIKQMGGDDVLRDRVRDILKGNRDLGSIYNSEELTMIASGLMWMNAYQEENMVLQHMLSTGQQMTAKTQERLHSLSNGGGKAPTGFDVTSSQNALYFDVSALAWKDDEYTGLFENLAFQDKAISYSLAVRDEDKELFITQGIQVPDTRTIHDRIREVFAEEYGDGVEASIMHCVALSGGGEENMDCILMQSVQCKHMGLLMHIVRIGKKLTIKFYTLFMPIGTNLGEQKQQALSLQKKLSPTVASWESSMKDQALEAVQQLLNAASHVKPNPGGGGEAGDFIF